jgi:hypothetical protein
VFITRRLLFTRRYRLFMVSLVVHHVEADYLLKHHGVDSPATPGRIRSGGP